MVKDKVLLYCENIMRVGFVLLALCIPVSIAATNILWALLMLAWIIKIILTRNYKFRPSKLDVPIMIFLSFSVISGLFSIDPQRTLRGLKSEFLVLLFYLIINNLRDRDTIRKVVRAFIIGSVLVSAFGIIQYFVGVSKLNGVIVSSPEILSGAPAGLLDFLSMNNLRVVATRSHPLTLAGGLMMSLAIVICLLVFGSKENRKQKLWLGIAAIIIGTAFVFTFSRGPWISMMLVLIFIEFVKPVKKTVPWALIFIFSVIIIAGTISFSMKDTRISIIDRVLDIKDSDRVYMWQSGWEMFKDYPLTGVGIKNISQIYYKYINPKAIHGKDWGELHNNFIQILVERGIFGLGAFLWLLISCFKEGIRRYRFSISRSRYSMALILGCLAAFLGFAIAGMVEYNYGDSEVVMMMWFLVGLLMVTDNSSDSDKRIAVFMDRDGTINVEKNYIGNPDEFELIERADEAIKLLNKHGILAFVITNQSGVGRGYFDEDAVTKIHEKMKKLLSERGAWLDGVYYCPHHPDDNCNCRKPSTGLLEKAADEFGLDLGKSYIIGDKYTDTELAHRVGAKGILVLTGYGKEQIEDKNNELSGLEPDYIADDLYDAAEWILNDCSSEKT